MPIQKIILTEEEAAMYSLISNKISCAKQALSPSTIPENASNEQVKLFLDNLASIIGGYEYLLEDWWKKINVKYNPEGGFIFSYDRKSKTLSYEVENA